MGCVLRGRSKALGVEGHLRQVGIQGYGRLPYGYPMDTLWDTMWIPYGVHCGDLGTLGGTLRTPGSSRERLERDSRQSQDSLKTVSTTPKAWIPKSEKSEMRSEPSHRNSSKSSSNKRKSDTKGEGGK